ncbi:MAG TPA: ABC transporter substrate-binding protein [Limnobacter sp.]|nr:ABC transporter substrate-binding protein [Limnobacter sp.]
MSLTCSSIRNLLLGVVFLGAFSNVFAKAATGEPVLVGLDAEFSLENSISAQSIETGLKVAMDEINARGGVLGVRPLQLVTKDNGSIPARGIKNIREFAAMPNLVAVFGGRFSPVLLEELPVLKETQTLLLAPWSSADPIVDNGSNPNYVFRLSLRDSLAMPKMLEVAKSRGIHQVGLLLTNTGWGRSNKLQADRYALSHPDPKIVHTAWYNFKDTSLIDKYDSLVRAGSKAIILVANDDEAATLVKEVAALPPEKRIPILSHWGVAGGQFVKQAGSALQAVDFSVIQTFSFYGKSSPALTQFYKFAAPYGIHAPKDIGAPTGVAHAYDLMQILARAIDLAKSTDRSKVRDALEKVKNYPGIVRNYSQPFSAERHEALTSKELFMARFKANGELMPVGYTKD